MPTPRAGYRHGMSDSRYTYPAEGDDPRQIDREFTDEEEQARLARERAVTNPAPRERPQGTSADAPGRNPSDRDRVD